MNAVANGISDSSLIPPKLAARYLQCSQQWLAVLRMQGRGPAYHKHGSWVRYRVSDLNAWANIYRIATADDTRDSAAPINHVRSPHGIEAPPTKPNRRPLRPQQFHL